MKTCEFDHVKLIDYAFGEAGEEIKKEVETHLQECSDCRTALSELKSTREIMHKWEEPEAPVRWIFAPQNVNRLHRIPEWLRLPSFTVPNWATAAAALIIVTLLTSSLFHTSLQISSQGVQIRMGGAQPPQKAENIVRAPASAEKPAVSNGAGMRPEEIILLVNTMLDSRDNRLRDEYRTLLSGVLKNVETQRAEDIKGIINALAQYEGRTDYWMKETNSVLRGIVQISQKEQ